MSGKKMLYSLRPSKHVERLMVVDACRRLEHIAALDRYEYVGFGALEFVDFELFHRALGLSTMWSIEKDVDWPERYDFNKPFRGITVLNGKASEHLPGLDWTGLRIVWLDYTDALTKEVVRDCETVARVLLPGSVLLVTVNATAPFKQRLSAVEANLGPEAVPAGVTEEELAGEWAFADLQRTLLTDRLETIMVHRADNAGLRQFANYHHQDSARMQTLGWVVSAPGMEKVIDSSGICGLSASRTGDEALVVKVPVLTRRESQHLNRLLPLGPGERLDESWLDDVAQNEYAHLYRWYPTSA